MFVGIESGLLYVNKSFHRPAREIHFPHSRTRQNFFELFIQNSQHQLVFDGADTHLVADHEAESAEHPLLRELNTFSVENRRDPPSELFVERHMTLYAALA